MSTASRISESNSYLVFAHFFHIDAKAGYWGLSLGVKWPGHEADYTPPSSAEVKNAWHCTSNPNTSSWRGA